MLPSADCESAPAKCCLCLLARSLCSACKLSAYRQAKTQFSKLIQHTTAPNIQAIVSRQLRQAQAATHVMMQHQADGLSITACVKRQQLMAMQPFQKFGTCQLLISAGMAAQKCNHHFSNNCQNTVFTNLWCILIYLLRCGGKLMHGLVLLKK